MQKINTLRLSAMASLACALLLSGCGEGAVSERLGLQRKAPDEFQVLSRPPLHIPPEFNLRAPTDGSDGEGLIAPAARQAEQAVFGERDGSAVTLQPGSAETAVMPVSSGEVASTTEQQFLDRAGAGMVDPGIRQTLREENGELGEVEEKSVLEKLRNPDKGEPTVDPAKEAERIKANMEAGKPVNDGEVEVKEPKDLGILNGLDGIF